MDVSITGALFAGVLSFLSPCVLPLVPPYLCFLAGKSLDQLLDDKADLSTSVWPSTLSFVAGFTTVFVMLGATASTMGQYVTEYANVLEKVAGTVIIILGLHFIGVFKISALYREARFHVDNKPSGLVGAYVIGLAFAFGWTPCVGPILASILMVAGMEDTVMHGVMLLTAYALGIGIPFMIAALFIKPFLSFMVKFRRHIGKVEKTMGALLVFTGGLFLTDNMSTIGFWLQENIPVLSRIG